MKTCEGCKKSTTREQICKKCGYKGCNFCFVNASQNCPKCNSNSQERRNV